MSNRLVVSESFGDAHTCYVLNGACQVDVVREGSCWRAYKKNLGDSFSDEIACAESEYELDLQLQATYR